jgi:hypothetical protein
MSLHRFDDRFDDSYSCEDAQAVDEDKYYVFIYSADEDKDDHRDEDHDVRTRKT